MGGERTDETHSSGTSTSAGTSARAAGPDIHPGSSTGQGTGAARAGGSATSERPRQLSERDTFRITLLRNAHYHEDRERFFARLHRLAMFVVVVSGTASFAFVRATPYLAAAITLAGLIDLVFDVSGKARLHASLRRRIYDVLAQTEDSARSIESLREQAVRVYADEPPCMHAVNAIAYNAAMQSFDRPRQHLFKVPMWYRLLRHWHSFATTQFKTYSEIETAKASTSGATSA
jgi:hypothetical protein